MTRVIIDAALRSKLHNLQEPLELCDEFGHVLARVVPNPDLSEYELAGPQISDEELSRRLRSNEKTHTTSEVLAYLERL